MSDLLVSESVIDDVRGDLIRQKVMFWIREVDPYDLTYQVSISNARANQIAASFMLRYSGVTLREEHNGSS